MNEDTKAQAVVYVLESTKTRNYRKHLADDLMNLIVRDILTAMNEWEGPTRSAPKSDDTDETQS